MSNNATYSIFIEKIFQKEPRSLIHFFHDSTFLKLTGANFIVNNFIQNGIFCLTFTNRGIIRGKYISISDQSIILDWNVEGFSRPDESNTLVEIFLTKVSDNCKFTLRHSNIHNQEAALAKEKAWSSILNEFEKIL